MERKPQQQTLSIRISDALREFLERSKQVISHDRGETVSTSDVAKILLESARDDRLDFRLEVAELQQAPTDSLAAVRKKWEQRQPLSRAEWIFLAQYVQVACEAVSENSAVPSSGAFCAVLESLLAVRALRTDRGTGLDRYYLSNLGVPEAAAFNERQFDPEFVPQVVTSLIRELRGFLDAKKAAFAGRNLYVALRDEALDDLITLNRVLEPHMAILFRMAARGHWVRERRPVRVRHEGPVFTSPIPAVSAGDLRLTASVSTEGEIQLALAMDGRGVSYPLGPYPEIQEFMAMLQQLEPGQTWDGLHFHASADTTTPGQPVKFQFRRRADGVMFTFAEAEWESLNGVFAAALAEPALQVVLAELALVYGEL